MEWNNAPRAMYGFVDSCFATFSFAYEGVVSSLSEIHKLAGFH